jgi:hypothetical protein
MTWLLAGVLLVAIWLARPRPLLRRDRGVYLSERWQRDHLYHTGKNGRG